MSLKQYCFKPSIKIGLLTLGLLPILVSLGIWQLHRADFKQQLQSRYNASAKHQPEWLHTLSASQDINYTPVKLQGQFDSQHIVFLDNKIYRHQIGYQVLVPFRPTLTHKAVLVNIGWIAQGRDRAQLPKFTVPNNEQLIYGMISELSTKPFSLGANADPSYHAWPQRLQYIDIAALTHKLGYPIEPFMVLLAPDQPFGLVRDWTPAVLNPQMHLGYAFQWFALAVTLIILFIISSIKRRSHP